MTVREVIVSKPGSRVELYARVRACRPGQTRGGQPYYDLTLADQTGAVSAKVWSGAQQPMEASARLTRDAHVIACGAVDVSQGEVQLVLDRLYLLSRDTELDLHLDPDSLDS